MQTEPEQWAVELMEAALAVFCENTTEDGALVIQRAFEERERKLRKFIRHDHTCTLGMRMGNDCVCGLAQAFKETPDAQ